MSDTLYVLAASYGDVTTRLTADHPAEDIRVAEATSAGAAGRG